MRVITPRVYGGSIYQVLVTVQNVSVASMLNNVSEKLT